ncbi:FIST signal transduction protein [Runella slithyformis]|uniref:FIST C domain-containing protein n=1 Tax=Runella slithyformis (strain ATCC 29530 / DSM 19594 / LMG 11500 / NCIMB 11436 / LSU 4) TaxID=761193 RepID=A0A7U4E441_RUNSL|nr:FIST N-terminal domain-containing protein [Runella slithyformis]AEI47096.1 FIST C domain-containing protein [Runella slithyformis DSM 19594]
MRIKQLAFQNSTWRSVSETPAFTASQAQLVLAFGERKCLEDIQPYEYLRDLFPSADIVINSTSGEIYQNTVHEGTIIVTAIEFDKTVVRTTKIDIENHFQSAAAGEQIAQVLLADDLAAIFMISDGGRVNGSDLIAALNKHTGDKIPISGGLAGDEARFEKTLVGLNENPREGKIVGIGFYGTHLNVGHGTMGGWDVFGPEREVTESEYNVLYKIGDKAALDLYKEYLGKYADELPGAALLFPLSMRATADSEPIVRTILSIDEAKKSMTFAGELPKGALVRFMKANFDRLIDASASAAQYSMKLFDTPPELAILVSCVGRKLVLGSRTEEEVEAAREIFGAQPVMTGFYSYGEISPLNPQARCELHNQTMTITTLSEK